MILGTGVDLCDVRRIERALARHGARFTQRVFTAAEQARPGTNASQAAAHYAKRFAAKEACAKALGTGFRDGLLLTDISVVNLPSGLPAVASTGAAQLRLAAMTPPGHVAHVFLSLTDEYPYAFAQVIISAEPLAPG